MGSRVDPSSGRNGCCGWLRYPSRRGRGIGDALLNALYDRAKAEGHEAVSLSVERDNDLLVSYYEQRHGFERIREDGGDTVIMRRAL